MGTQSKNYYFGVVENVSEMGDRVNFSEDELDIIDDFEMQGFSELACAEHLLKYRKAGD